MATIFTPLSRASAPRATGQPHANGSDPTGQVLALERAYADADVDIGNVTMIEAHGTGTAMGDKSEIE